VYRVVILPRFEKDMKRVPASGRARIVAKLAKLSDGFASADVKRLVSHEPGWCP